MKVTLKNVPEVIKMHHGVIIKTKKNGCIISCASSLEMPSCSSALSIMEEVGLCRGNVLRWQKGEEGSYLIILSCSAGGAVLQNNNNLRKRFNLVLILKAYISFRKGSVSLKRNLRWIRQCLKLQHIRHLFLRKLLLKCTILKENWFLNLGCLMQ